MNIDDIKKRLLMDGLASLVIDQLVLSDLDHLQWSGNKSHLEHVRLQIIAPGETIQLAVRAYDKSVMSKGLLDFSQHDSSGMISQLATHPQLQSLGLGTILITAMEQEMQRRGCQLARLGVEPTNPKALRLYERLGYVATNIEQHSWMATNSEGDEYLHKTDVQMMSKQLG